jgi:hypothetical protein
MRPDWIFDGPLSFVGTLRHAGLSSEFYARADRPVITAQFVCRWNIILRTYDAYGKN